MEIKGLKKAVTRCKQAKAQGLRATVIYETDTHSVHTYTYTSGELLCSFPTERVLYKMNNPWIPVPTMRQLKHIIEEDF